MEQNAPEKKIPSTAAKATNRSANESLSIHLIAQSAFFLTQSIVSSALNKYSHVNINIPTKSTQRIQEMHILIGHITK